MITHDLDNDLLREVLRIAKMCTVPLSDEQQRYLSSGEKLMQYIVAGSFPRRNSYSCADDLAVSNTRIRVPAITKAGITKIVVQNKLPIN